MKTREQIEQAIKKFNLGYLSYSREQYLLKQIVMAQIIALEWVLEDEHEEQVIDWVEDD